MGWLSTWIEARKEVALKKLEMEEKRREQNRQDMLAKERKRSLEDKFAMVEEIIENWTNHNRLQDKETSFKIHYQLYENEFNKRKLVVHCSDADVSMDDCYKTSPNYIQKVMPWLEGSYVSEVKTYDQAKQDEMVERIKNGG